MSEYTYDPGRRLTPLEIEELKSQITPIHLIKRSEKMLHLPQWNESMTGLAGRKERDTDKL